MNFVQVWAISGTPYHRNEMKSCARNPIRRKSIWRPFFQQRTDMTLISFIINLMIFSTESFFRYR